MNVFTLPVESYTRQVEILPNYIDDNALYLSRMRNISIADATAFIKKEIQPSGRAPAKDPVVHYLQRDKKTGDRYKAEGTLSGYLKTVTEFKLIMVPTMTVYLNPNQKRSHNALYIATNVSKRKVFKKQMLTAKMKGDKLKYSYYDILQNSCKIKNNSVSGAHASPSTPLFNKSSHSTLTSTCRISTSYTNAANECFLGGNRHYWCPQVVISHLITSCRHTDLHAVTVAMSRHDLYYPTVVDVMDCIEYSTALYWRSPTALNEIQAFVETMRPAERAAFVYSGDLYHLAKYNHDFVRVMFTRLIQKAETPDNSETADALMRDGDLCTLAALICATEVNGRQVSEIKLEDKQTYGLLAGTAKNAYDTTISYIELIHALWRPTVLLPSIATLPTIVRRIVVTSDTDSSIFTTQYWTQWYVKGNLFSETAYRIGYACTYLVSNLVKHRLGLMSANLGAITEHIHGITMKNEYYFPVFVLTPAAKHYYALRSAQEGNVFKEMETEIKGVHLRDSSAPPAVTKLLKQYMEMVMQLVIKDGSVSIHDILGPVARLEHSIIDDIAGGGYTYLKSTQVKDAASYAQGAESANYKRYLFWEEIFADKYGHAPQPPYQAVKVSVGTDSSRKFRKWVDELCDRAVADKFNEWSLRTGKKDIQTFVVPLAIVLQHGMPSEIISAMNVRKLVKNIVSPFYLVLESLGIYMQNDHISRLISDTYVPPIEVKPEI